MDGQNECVVKSHTFCSLGQGCSVSMMIMVVTVVVDGWGGGCGLFDD